MHAHIELPEDGDPTILESMSDSARLDLGRQIFEKGFSADDRGVGFTQIEAEVWLTEEMGFEVEFVQPEDDRLLILLWKYGPDPEHILLDEFIIQFSGWDAANITLFCLTASMPL